MIVVDTNILVRYAIRDDIQQAEIAKIFLQKHECLILKSVLLELVWVLSAGYKLPKEKVIERIHHIICLPTISTEDANNVLLALQWYEHGMDFGDALHLVTSTDKAEGFSTFDKGIVNTAKRLNIQHEIHFLSGKGKN